MEKLTWFKFVISDWMMGKIMKCPEVTQARFLRLCCLYWNKECVLSYEDAEIEVDEDHLKILISKKILLNSDGYISIKFLDEQNEGVLSLSETRRLAAKERWDKLKKQANEMQVNAFALIPDANAMQIDAEKIRVDKSREEKKRLEEEDKNSTTPDSIPRHNFYLLSEFEKIEIAENEFTLLAIRAGGGTIENVKNMFNAFIIFSKGIGQKNWKDETDAKKHFINWLKKQPKQISTSSKPKETVLEKHRRRMEEQKNAEK